MILSLSRKSFPGTLLENIQAYGTGALNIDDCRVPCAGGKFPANVFALHHPECEISRYEKQSYKINRWDDGALPFGGAGGKGLSFTSVEIEVMMPVWSCHSECTCPPSMHEHIAPMQSKTELLEYLKTLICPPNGDLLVINAKEISSLGSEQQYHGAVVLGDLEGDMERLWEALYPGAYVVTLPETSTGDWKNACVLEDQGFEVRDSIFVVENQDDFFYCPKPSVREKTAGCEYLEDSEHPTVKPLKMMRHMLKDIPSDRVVLEPFMGSGSTAIASLKTGHDVVAIEQDKGYLDIATSRLAYWNQGMNRAEINAPEDEEKKDVATNAESYGWIFGGK
ncbi:MAG: DNA methyltransferase [Bacteroidota bacterium]